MNPSALDIAMRHHRAITHTANNLRAWRTYCGMTQRELAGAVATTECMISLLENGWRGLSKRWLERLAPVLETTPGAILDFAPEDIERDIVRAALAVPLERRAHATAFLRRLTRESRRLAAARNEDAKYGGVTEQRNKRGPERAGIKRIAPAV
jgi:transcriptional regulator with XRE-family HTH domain